MQKLPLTITDGERSDRIVIIAASGGHKHGEIVKTSAQTSSRGDLIQ